jgi:succinate dehydrogenase hydrophobic anchor subunit
MSYAMDTPIAVRASESARTSFIRRTYLHLAGAILAFAAIDFLIFSLFTEAQMHNTFVQMFRSPWSA